MKAAAMQILDQPEEIDELTSARFTRWRRDLAAFVMAQGLRASLEHVEVDRWVEYFERGEQPEEAALQEILRCAE